jgi:integrase
MKPQASGKVFNISASKVRKDFEALREKIGMPELHMHDLRHTFSSVLQYKDDEYIRSF